MNTKPETAEQLRAELKEAMICGCGKPIRYEVANNKLACNKYFRCLTREEALESMALAHQKINALNIELKKADELLLDAWQQYANERDGGLWAGGLSTLEWIQGYLLRKDLIDDKGNIVK